MIVDPENGPCRTIQQAIDISKPNSIIRVSSGLYRENLIIRIAPLRIEAKDASAEIYIMGIKGPTIYVDISSEYDENGEVFISHVRLTHKGGGLNKSTDKSKPDALTKQKSTINDSEEFSTILKKIEFSTNYDSLLYINKGKVRIANCLLTLAMLLKCTQPIISAVICSEKTNIIIDCCSIKGNHDFPCCGIALRNANMKMGDTTVSNFSEGGIIMQVNSTSKVTIKKSKISYNLKLGIQIMGNSLHPLIEECNIENNDCSGIMVCINNKCNIRKNEICTNQNGIEIYSSDPYISENRIRKNYKHGVFIISSNLFLKISLGKYINIKFFCKLLLYDFLMNFLRN